MMLRLLSALLRKIQTVVSATLDAPRKLPQHRLLSLMSFRVRLQNLKRFLQIFVSRLMHLIKELSNLKKKPSKCWMAFLLLL